MLLQDGKKLLSCNNYFCVKTKTDYMRNLKLIFALTLFCASFFTDVFAQKKENISEDYRRSSLCVMLVEEPRMPMADTIKDAFVTLPMPDKYNDHNIGERIINSADAMFVLTERDKELFEEACRPDEGDTTMVVPSGKKMSGLFFGTGNTTSSSSAVSADDFAKVINRYLVDNKVAKQLVDGWFISDDSLFTMEKVKERGLYAATVLDVETAKKSARGMAMLEDAGEELISNTFVVVSRYNYISKDELVESISTAMRAAASAANNAYVNLGVNAAILALKASLGAGYYVKSTSYLFKLRWTPEISHLFYSDLWDNMEAYEKSDMFSLRYVGSETAWANVKEGIFTDKTTSELIRIATINSTDAVVAKLAKRYDVFKTKTPLVVTEEGEMYAYIGTKEGVEGGDKFEVLERVEDPESGKTHYFRRGVVKVDNSQIWDNRYAADEELKLKGKEQEFKYTKFKGQANKYYSGMLLRQIK